jgi:hypothetical protein
MGRVVSEIYVDNSDIWGKDRYPIRVRIKIDSDKIRTKRNAIPLDTLYGTNPNSEFTISPFLKNTWIAPISIKQHENLERAFRRDC